MLVRFSLAFLCFVLVEFVCGKNVEERLNELERIINLQSETLSKHELVIREQRDNLEKVMDENEVLKARVEYLENEIGQITVYRDNDFKIKRESEAGQQSLKIASKQNISDEDGKSLSGTTFLENNEKRQTDIQRAQVNVAFHAHQEGSPCLNAHEVVVYGYEEIDIGSGYNKDDGIYIVPTTGVYVFTWTSMARLDCLVTDIMVNGHAKATSTADSIYNTELDQASGLIVTHVTAGDHVFIRAAYVCGCKHNDSSNQSTFSGWLLF